jgi:hypothetical protein
MRFGRFFANGSAGPNQGRMFECGVLRRVMCKDEWGLAADNEDW